jgi:hypothetical protein
MISLVLFLFCSHFIKRHRSKLYINIQEVFEDFLGELAQIIKDKPQYAGKVIECCAQALAKTNLNISG